MLPHLDIHPAANLLIEQHGEDAPIFAAMQAHKRLEAGEMKEQAV